MKSYYQPAGLVGWVTWAWILMIAMFGTIMWLEVTHINVWAYWSYGIFAVIALGSIFRRRVTMTGDAIRFPPVIGVHAETIHFADMQFVQFNKHTVIFSHEGEQYSYWMSRRFLQAFKEKVEG